MDFRHHVKCTVHVVLGVAIIGIVYQHLPSAVSPLRTIKCPPDVNNPGLWEEMTGRPSDNACSTALASVVWVTLPHPK